VGLALIAIGAVSVRPTAARAQEASGPAFSRSFDAHHFHLAPLDGDLRDPLVVQRPGRFEAFDGWGAAVLSFSDRPLVRYQLRNDGTYRQTPLLDDVLALNLSGGVALHERFRLDAAVPVYLTSYDGVRRSQGVDFGDLRLTAMAPVLLANDDDTGAGLAVYANATLPTGAKRDFLGQRTVSGGGGLAFSYAGKPFTLSAEAGLQFRPGIILDNIVGADVFRGGLGLGAIVHPTTSVNVEAVLDVPFTASEQPGTETPLEVLASVKHRRPSGAFLVAGGAAGVTDGAGAPRFRVFVGGGYGMLMPPPVEDADLDGLADDVDGCPTDPETFNQHADADGCPDQLADVDVRAIYDGEPVGGVEVKLAQRGTIVEETLVTEEGARMRPGLMPGDTWTASAALGLCLVGRAEVTLREGRNDLYVNLEAERRASVRYEVTDLEGRPLADAVASWRTTSVGCVDPAYRIGADGRLTHPLGVGAHTVFVEVPGYRVFRQEVAVRDGDVFVIRAALRSSKVQVADAEIRILEQVFFETGSDTILEASYELLDEVVEAILRNPVGRVQIEGHTDDRAADAYNLDLSQRRAAAVRIYLIDRGVPEAQLTAVGYGESRPIAPNTTAAGRAQNRRVVFTLLDKVAPSTGGTP
jgi:outer membrane protein OmpA-like peptidoglycan-associated protein